MARVLPLLTGIVLLASGCLGMVSQREVRYHLHKAKGDWPSAMQELRDEVASPRTTTNPDLHAVNVRHIYLTALGEYALLHGLRPEMDEEAKRAYDSGFRYAKQDPAKLATLHQGIAIYYVMSARSGTALPYLRKEQDVRRQVKDPVRDIILQDSLATAYDNMGELAVAAHHQGLARSMAAAYFVVGQRPSEDTHWDGYVNLLEKWMTAAVERGDREDLDRLWAITDAATERHQRAKSMTRFNGADHYAIIGDHARARALLDKATKLSDADAGMLFGMLRAFFTVVRVCKSADVRANLGELQEALRGFGECDKALAALNMPVMTDMNEPRVRGDVYEQTGDLDRAVAEYRRSIDIGERLRSAFSVQERAAFFRGPVRKAYWGLIRAAARRAAADPSPAGLFEAVRAGELVRARQLGELMGAGEELSPEAFRDFRAALGPDEIVLAYSLMDRHLVLLAFTADRHVTHVAAHEGPAFRREVLGVATALGSPDSPMTDLGARLTALGTRLLGPARPLLDGRTKILVLPDGVLSAVPFESLGVGGESYRPLVADATVRVAPSLRLVLARQRGLRAGGATLLALADPVYAKSPAPGSLTKDELALVARNSRFLDYFTPLPETRTEVQAIARLFPSGSSEILVGDAARESVLKKTDLLRFRHVHLATHGILGGEVPGVGEPALVLGEEPGEDGFLTASEVERLKLDADLTVLSACNTGSGEYFTGEGVMGLSRSFLLAGSRAVVVSLWPVASKATERFMVDLYGHLRTLPTAEALRRAKLDMIERARRSGGPEAHPFFWAPFIVFGG